MLRTLTQDGEAILPTEDEVVSSLVSPIQVYLPTIGDGTGNTCLPGWTLSITTQAVGAIIVLDHNKKEVTRIKPRSSQLFCAIETPGYGWSYADHPLAYPGTRIIGLPAPGPHTHVIADVLLLQATLDAKAALVHTHIVSDVTGLQAVLDGKALAAHTHDAADLITGTLAAARLPVATTAAKGASKVDNNSAGDPIALTSAGHGAAADPHPQYALDTEKGAASGIATLDGAGKLTSSQLPLGTSASTAAVGNDSRLSDARTPTAHGTSHQPGGSDPMAVDAVAATGSLRTLGAGAQQAAAGNHTHADKIRGNSNTADVVANAADTYLTGSAIPIAGVIKAGSVFRWKFRMTKTAAGVATPIWNIRVGTAGTVADTARVILTALAQTGVIDDGWCEIECTVRTFSATGVIEASLLFTHTLAATGLSTSQMKTLSGNSATFDITAASLQIGVSCNPGAAGVWTFQHVSAEAWNLA